MTRISDMTELTTLPATGAFVPVEKAGSTTNFRYNLGNVPTTDSLFVNASSLSVPTGFNMVATSGYSTIDVGGAIYTYAAAVDAAYVIAHPRSSFVTVNSRGFRLSLEQDINPEMLGAPDITDDYAAFQAMLDLLPAAGGNVTVLAGAYKLLTTPTWGVKDVHWNISSAATFSGAGAATFLGTARTLDVGLRTDLAASTGFTLIKYKPAATGTFARTAAELQTIGGADDSNGFHFIDPLLDGAILAGTNTTDLTAYLQAAHDNGNGRIALAIGTFRYTTLNFNRSGFQLLGGGFGRTTLLRAGATTGDAINFGDGAANPVSCLIQGMTLSALAPQTAGALVRVKNAHNFTAEKLQFASNIFRAIQLDGGASQYEYRLTDLEANSASDAAIVVGEAGGIVQDLWITRAELDCLGVGVDLVNASGTFLTDVDVIHALNAYRARPDTNQRVNALFAVGCIADTCSSHGWKLAPVNTGFVGDWGLDGCAASSCGTSDNGDGFHADPGAGNIDGITAGQMRLQNNKGRGAQLLGGNNYKFSGAECVSDSAQGSGVVPGFEIAGTTGGVTIDGGKFGLGGLYPTNFQSYGIKIGASATNILIAAEDVRGNVTGGINDLSGSAQIVHCLGFVTEARGAGTVANGTSSVVINHGLAATPLKSDIILTWNSALITAAQVWVSAATSTQFTVTTNVNVGADFFFGWDARVKGA